MKISTVFGLTKKNIIIYSNMRKKIHTGNLAKSILILGGMLFFTLTTQAQTDAMFTKYMFNSLIYNPAYAGSKEHMSLALIHRSQWLGVKGGPNAQSLTIHTPFKGFDRIGIGGNIVNQNIGTSRMVSANMSYAYRIRLGKEEAGTISIGLQGGVTNWRANLKNLDVYDNTDEAFSEEFPSYWLPNVGFGLYYYSKFAFLGISVPNILEHDLRELNLTTERYARTARHYYLTFGGAIPVKGDDLIIKPMVLVKSAALLSGFKNEEDSFNNYGAPTEFSADLSVLFRETLWVGASFRSAVEAFTGTSSFDSVDVWASYQMKNGMVVGLAYDYTLTELQRPTKASFEVMLGVEFNYDTEKTYSPRYF